MRNAIIAALIVTAATLNAQPSAPKVNVNTATAAQLQLLPGIGTVIAQRVIEYRTQHGQFRQASDLMQVKGIGAKKLAALQPFIALTGSSTVTGKLRAPHPSPVVPR